MAQVNTAVPKRLLPACVRPCLCELSSVTKHSSVTNISLVRSHVIHGTPACLPCSTCIHPSHDNFVNLSRFQHTVKSVIIVRALLISYYRTCVVRYRYSAYAKSTVLGHGRVEGLAFLSKTRTPYSSNMAQHLDSRCVLVSIRPRQVPYHEPTVSIPLLADVGS